MAAELKYKKEYCDMLVKHMSQGYSFSTFGAKVDVTRQTCYEWVDKYPEFKKAKSLGEQKAQDFIEKRLMAKLSGQDLSALGIDTKKIDTTALIFALKTRFHKDYGERQKIEQTVEQKTIQINIDKEDERV